MSNCELSSGLEIFQTLSLYIYIYIQSLGLFSSLSLFPFLDCSLFLFFLQPVTTSSEYNHCTSFEYIVFSLPIAVVSPQYSLVSFPYFPRTVSPLVFNNVCPTRIRNRCIRPPHSLIVLSVSATQYISLRHTPA